MKKMIVIAAGLGLLGAATSAMAEQPVNPGKFGTDRAAQLKIFQADQTSPGASEWGHIAADRAGTNGTVNRQYRDDVQASPTTGKPTAMPSQSRKNK